MDLPEEEAKVRREPKGFLFKIKFGGNTMTGLLSSRSLRVEGTLPLVDTIALTNLG